MHKFLVKVVLVATALEAVALFFIGPNFGVLVEGIHWGFLDLALMIMLYLALVTWPLENRFHKSPGALRSLKVLALVFIPFLAWGIYRGAVNDRYGYRAYTIAIVWLVGVALTAYSARMSWQEIQSWLRILWVPQIILAALTIMAVLGRYLFEFEIPFNVGYYGYSVLYLFSFGMSYTFIRVFLSGHSSWLDRVGLVVFSMALALVFAKKIIVPAFASILVIMWLVSFRSSLRLSRMVLYLRLVTFLVASLLLVILIFLMLEPGDALAELVDYYVYSWQVRFLHSDIGDVSGGRFYLWTRSFEMLKLQPFQGYGLGVRVDNPGSTLKPFVSSHNTIIHFFLALGIPGGIVFVALVVRTVQLMSKSLQVNDRDEFLLRLALFAYSCGFLVLSTVDMFSIMQAAYVLFAVCVGFLLRFYVDDSVQRKSRLSSYAAPDTKSTVVSYR